MRAQPWFCGKEKTIKEVALKEIIPLPTTGEPTGFLVMAQVDYVQGEPEQYSMPLALVRGEEAQRLRANLPHLIISELNFEEGPPGLLYDAMGSPEFCRDLVEIVAGCGPNVGGLRN